MHNLHCEQCQALGQARIPISDLSFHQRMMSFRAKISTLADPNVCVFLPRSRKWFLYVGYNYTAYMDYMDLAARCPQKGR